MSRKSVISPEEIHLFLAFPEEIRDPQLLAAYREVMVQEEREKQQRFHFERHRHQYLIARVLLRTTLSRYTGIAPDELQFSINPYGRPELHAAEGLPPLRFNLSHTRGIVVCAVALEKDIGVDVEDTGRKVGLELADRFFSDKEKRDLHAVDLSVRRTRFFEYWTLKEAYVKARGMGLAIPLDRFSFRIEEHRPLSISFENPSMDRPEEWLFWLLQAAERYRVGLAVRGGAHLHPVLSCRKVIPLAGESPVELAILHSS